MCGLFGLVGRADRDKLVECARMLSHRGPDAFSSYSDEKWPVFLAHCRLSIIDLSDRALQPMSSHDGQVCLVFNGEIYNFRALRTELEQLGRRFRTDSDTEVILHAYEVWGSKCLERLTGMFAIGIWDRRRNQLLLARDRLGIKPLYVYRGHKTIAFASEPKALVGLPDYNPEIDQHGLVTYLLYGYVIGRPSIWRDIERLPPGSWAVYDLSAERWTEGIYWKLENQPQDWTLEDATDRMQDLLDTVVADHMVADVPVGVMLSGGLDSSLIAASAARARPAVQTFTIGFAGWDLSETDDASAVANYLRLPHHVHVLDMSTFGNPQRVLDLFDEPLADTGIFPTATACEMARQHATVALSGDGGDELFGGYVWYLQLEALPMRRKLAYFVESFRRQMGVGRVWPQGVANRGEYYRFLNAPSFNLDEMAALFPWLDQARSREILEAISNNVVPRGCGRYRRWQLYDAGKYLIDNNLTRVDRSSMAFGLEVRVPFLDHRIVEFAFSLPEHLCIADSETKVLLRHLANRRLPPHNVAKLKQGFSCPIERYWPAKEMAASVRGGTLVSEEIVSRNQVDHLLDGSGFSNTPYQIWVLAALERWSQRWLCGCAET
ncbi:MAG TPA: asparagine synthase (glutamine-hydrolyzing) [Planctomycetaceae bacterium]|jgi:asparagine synthase (glutamine-hydrolysing)